MHLIDMARPNSKTRKTCESRVARAMKKAVPKVGTRKQGVRITQKVVNSVKPILAGVEKNAKAMCGMSPEEKKKALKKMFSKMINRM